MSMASNPFHIDIRQDPLSPNNAAHRDSVNLKPDMGGTEKTSTMKDSFTNQHYYVDSDPKVQMKHKKDTVVFGSDKSNYFKVRNSRTSAQDLSNISKETKQIADSVKQRLNMHNFKFGSYLPDYTSTSITGDKLVLSPDLKSEAMKQQSASDIKKRMASTQNSWIKMNALKSFDSQITKSRGKLDIRENSEVRELKQNNLLVSQPKRLIAMSKSPIVFQEKIDPNNPSSLSNSFKNKPKQFWDVNRASFGKTQSSKTGTQSPLAKKHNITEGYIQLGENQKPNVSGTTTTESFRPGAVSANEREKDKEVHDFMKKKNVHLGSFNNDPNTVAKSSFPTYNKNVVEELNTESKINSNFIKSFYISGSPARERPIQGKQILYGDKIDGNSNDTNNQNEKNRQLKKDLLSHAFNLGYGKDTHKRVPSVDITHGMKKSGEILRENSTLKKKNEKQNFKYSEDIAVRSSDSSGQVNSSSAARYLQGVYQKEKLPMDYWKTNFTFNQVDKKTETGSLNCSSSENQNNNNSKMPLSSSTKIGFTELKSASNRGQSENVILQRNKEKSIKSSFVIGHSKGEFNTSYKNQFIWKVPKVDV